MEQYLLPLALSTIAGLSTVLGGLVTFFIRKDSIRILSLGLGFSAGVMVLISLFEFLPESRELVIKYFGEHNSWYALIAFAGGILIAVLIDYFIPDHIEGHPFQSEKSGKIIDEHASPDNAAGGHVHRHSISEGGRGFIPKSSSRYKHASFIKNPHELSRLRKAGLLTAITVAVHNLPEGLATFFAASTDITLGITVVIAIAIHNIPEGIAVALPVYQSTGSKRKSLLYTFLSGMAEPLGGILGFILISSILGEASLGIMFGMIAGIMTYISFDTLLPLSREYDTGHYSITGVVLGMLLMATVLFAFGH